MPKRITKQAEEKILKGAEQMVDMVESGESPSAALAKVAAEGDFPPGHIRLMAQAFNTGKVNYHRKSSNALLDKIASFPLADASFAISKLYPDHVKSAATTYRTESVSDEYSHPPLFLKEAEQMEKRASVLPSLTSNYVPVERDTSRFYARAYGCVEGLEKEREEKRGQVATAKYKFAQVVEDLDHYFKLAHRPTNYPDALENATLLWGKPAEALLKSAAQNNSALAKEKAFDYYQGQVDLQREPYKSIDKAIKLAEDCREKQAEFLGFSAKAVKATEELAKKLAAIQPVSTVAPGTSGSSLMKPPSGARGSGKSTIGSQLAKQDPHIGVKDLDDFDDEEAQETIDWLAEPETINLLTAHGYTPTEIAAIAGTLGSAGRQKSSSLLDTTAMPKTSADESFLGGIGKATGGAWVADQIKKQTLKDTDKLNNAAYEDLTDPAHEARLRKIRVQAILHDMLANDPYISAEHPEKVTDLFNKVTQLAPHSADQPLLMQSIMRRYLAQGQTDPHDLDQLVGIESELKKQNNPLYAARKTLDEPT